MKELGERLRTAREEQGFSIDDLHERTKIRQRIIEAIEAGRLDVIPGGSVYIKGFIKTLAEELGLNYAELMSTWEPISAPQKVEVPEKASYRPSVYPFIGAVVMVLALIAAGVYYMYLRPQPQLPPPVTPPEVKNPPITQDPVEPVEPDVPKQPQFSLVSDTGGRLTYEVTTWPLELVVRVNSEACWAGVTADGRFSEVTLSAGQERTFTANNSLEMRLGKARVAVVYVNGEALPGQTVDVRDYTFRKAGP